MAQTVTTKSIPDVLKPIGPDYDADLTYVQSPKKAPPWLDAQPVDHEDLPDDFDVDKDTDVYAYPDAAGEILVDKILQLYDVDYDDIIAVNMLVGSKNGEEIAEDVRDGEVPMQALLAEIETIIRCILSGRGIEWAEKNGDEDKVSDFMGGWMDAGHWGLERVFFKMDGDDKSTVALSLIQLRDDFIEMTDADWTRFENRETTLESET